MGTENLGKKLGKDKAEKSRQGGAKAHADATKIQKCVEDRRTADKAIAKMRDQKKEEGK